MVMSCPASLRDRLPALWRKIEEAHYSYLETEESPEKLQQKKKLEAFVTEYLSLVPHECKFGLAETGEVFRRTVTSAGFSAYRAGLGWAAVARYAGNILAQPWRKEYRVLRTYCGYYKHEVEANLVGAESLLMVMGYKRERGARLVLTEPVCPDTVAAVSRDALIAHVECQIMCEIWEGVYGAGNVTWQDIYRARAARVGDADTHRDYIRAALQGAEIYSNISMPSSSEPSHRSRLVDPRYQESNTPCSHLHEDIIEEPINPIITQSYMIPPQMMYEAPATIPQCAPMPVMTPYGPIPYYFPIQNPYMIPTPVYPAIKHATNVPINGYPPIPQYRYPTVPTAQLIELDSDSTVYENGKHYREDDRKKRMESLRRNSTSKSGFSDVTLPSLPRSDTQPTLSKAKEDGMGTYESWDYVFRNLSSKDQDVDNRSRFSSSLDRDSRTLDRLDREERRARYQPTTLDLEDGLQALNLDRTYDDDVYRTAKVNENLMKLKQEQELKRARHLARKQVEQKKRPESIGHPKADGLIISKIAPDKVKLIPKKDKKDVVKQSSVNGSSTSIELKKSKKPTKLVALDVEKPRRPVENGVHSAHSSKSNIGPSTNNSNHELKAQLIVSLDETDSLRHSPPKPTQNGDRLPRTSSRHSSEKGTEHMSKTGHWECGTCTYLNKGNTVACEMCGKSKKGPEIEPLTSGGRECPACTLVNKRDARICDACGSSLEHCPTYI